MEANRDNAERLALIVPGRDEPVAPTHWSFGQLCTIVGAPTSYLRQLPALLSGINPRKNGFSKSETTKIWGGG